MTLPPRLAPARSLKIASRHGEARVLLDQGTGDTSGAGAKPGASPVLVAITHGAGGGVDTPDLLAVRDAAVALGAAVGRVVQPYLLRGGRAPGSQARQDEAWIDVVGALRKRIARSRARATARPERIRVIVGGRSNGARLACRTARAAGADAVIALAFPMHPPGRPERSRRGELLAAGVDVFAVSGAGDPFGIPDPADVAQVVVLPGEGHSLSRAPAALRAAITPWLAEQTSRGG
jgi:predicted alpha/beta-hydrolase family hydrolase